MRNLNICLVFVVFALVPASFLVSSRIPMLILVVFVVCSKLKTENLNFIFSVFLGPVQWGFLSEVEKQL